MMIDVVWRSCARSSLHNNNNTNKVQPIVAHSCGGVEELRLVHHSTTTTTLTSLLMISQTQILPQGELPHGMLRDGAQPSGI